MPVNVMATILDLKANLKTLPLELNYTIDRKHVSLMRKALAP